MCLFHGCFIACDVGSRAVRVRANTLPTVAGVGIPTPQSTALKSMQ
jgi:hypothetical protein